jgi:hypothetical protein
MGRVNTNRRPGRAGSWLRTVEVLCLVGVTLLAGCSSKSKTAGPTAGGASSSVTPSNGSTVDTKALQRQVKAAMTAAPAFHLVGSATDDKGKPLKLDIHFATDKAAGSITRDGQKIGLINPGGASVYFRLPDGVWKQLGGPSAVALLSGKWVKVPANDARFAEVANSFDKDSFVAEMTSDGSSSATLRKVGTDDVNGQPAVKYKSSKGTEIYVAATGPPVILKTVDPSATGGTLIFSDYGEHYPFAPPPAGQTVDYTKLLNR